MLGDSAESRAHTHISISRLWYVYKQTINSLALSQSRFLHSYQHYPQQARTPMPRQDVCRRSHCPLPSRQLQINECHIKFNTLTKTLGKTV